MPKELNDIQKEFRAKGVEQSQLIKDLGVSQSYASNLMNGKSAIGKNRAAELNKLYGLDIDILLGLNKKHLNDSGGFVEPFRKPRIEVIPVTVMPDPDEFEGNDHKFAHSEEGVIAMRVKIVPAKAQLGYLRGFADPEYFENFDYEIIPINKEARGTYLGFETVGRSMVNLTSDWWADKSIFPNRIAIGRELNREAWRSKLHIHSNDAWIIVHKTDGILLKEIINHDVATGDITIHSWNPDKEQYPDEVINLEDVAQLFNVLKVVDSRR